MTYFGENVKIISGSQRSNFLLDNMCKNHCWFKPKLAFFKQQCENQLTKTVLAANGANIFNFFVWVVRKIYYENL
jgi:hypothetical protein